MIKQTKIEGTPFTQIEQEGKHFLVMGNHRITDDKKTEEQAWESLDKEKWLIIMHMIIIAIEKVKEQEKLKGGFDPNK